MERRDVGRIFPAFAEPEFPAFRRSRRSRNLAGNRGYRFAQGRSQAFSGNGRVRERSLHRDRGKAARSRSVLQQHDCVESGGRADRRLRQAPLGAVRRICAVRRPVVRSGVQRPRRRRRRGIQPGDRAGGAERGPGNWKHARANLLRSDLSKGNPNGIPSSRDAADHQRRLVRDICRTATALRASENEID